MKKLILMRHAQAEPIRTTTDFERSLHAEGIQEAERISSYLASTLEYQHLCILSSSARRTMQTAHILAKALGYSETRIQKEDKLYLASEKRILKIINKIEDAYDCVIVVGHNPGITDFASYITGNQDIYMQTAGIVSISLEENFNWNMLSLNSAYFNFYKSPDEY